jgi:hypothetical protein
VAAVTNAKTTISRAIKALLDGSGRDMANSQMVVASSGKIRSPAARWASNPPSNSGCRIRSMRISAKIQSAVVHGVSFYLVGSDRIWGLKQPIQESSITLKYPLASRMLL